MKKHIFSAIMILVVLFLTGCMNKVENETKEQHYPFEIGDTVTSLTKPKL